MHNALVVAGALLFLLLENLPTLFFGNDRIAHLMLARKGAGLVPSPPSAGSPPPHIPHLPCDKAYFSTHLPFSSRSDWDQVALPQTMRRDVKLN